MIHLSHVDKLALKVICRTAGKHPDRLREIGESAGITGHDVTAVLKSLYEDNATHLDEHGVLVIGVLMQVAEPFEGELEASARELGVSADDMMWMASTLEDIVAEFDQRN